MNRKLNSGLRNFQNGGDGDHQKHDFEASFGR